MDRREFTKRASLLAAGAVLPRFPDIGRPVPEMATVIRDILEFEVDVPFKTTTRTFTAKETTVIRGVKVWTKDRKLTQHYLFDVEVWLAAGDSFQAEFKWHPQTFGLS